MFVVTALHTRRRPLIGIDKSGATIEKQRVERLPAASHSRRHLRPGKLSSLSSSQAATRRVSEPRMTRNDNDRDAWNRNDKGRRPPIKVPSGRRPTPTRIRKFIPKPLILVERMKARQLLLESSPPVASESCVAPESCGRPTTATATPLSAHVTPRTHRIPTCSVLSSDSHSSSSVSFRLSSRNGVVFRSGFEMMPRSVRPLSVVTLADSSSSTDTFVADSPCYIKQGSSKFSVLAVTNVHPNVDSNLDWKGASDTGVPVFVAAGSVHGTCQSTNTFEPVMTSTPIAPSRTNTSYAPPPTASIISTVYPTRPLEQTPGFSDSIEIVSPTSREVYPFNDPKGAYIVKLPNAGSTVSLSNRTHLASLSSTALSYSRLTKSGAPLATSVNAPKPALDLRRLSSRVASPSPTLVLDGVFALPHVPPPSSPRRTLNGFPRPRKPTSRRPLSDMSNALGITCSSQPVSTFSTPPPHGQPGPESPRSKLAHVLTAHVEPQMMTRARTQARVPLRVKGIQVSNDPRTQYEIEGLRVRRAVGLGRGVGGDGDCDGDGRRGVMERMSLTSVGMVAKLRARWEAGTGEHRGGVDGCA